MPGLEGVRRGEEVRDGLEPVDAGGVGHEVHGAVRMDEPAAWGTGRRRIRRLARAPCSVQYW